MKMIDSVNIGAEKIIEDDEESDRLLHGLFSEYNEE